MFVARLNSKCDLEKQQMDCHHHAKVLITSLISGNIFKGEEFIHNV
jgi:hypothetical protein